MTPIDATEFLKIVNYITSLVPVFMALAGWGALVAILINLGKTVGLIKDGMAPKVNLVLNLVGFVVLAALGLFNLITPEYFDQVAGALAAMLTAVIGLVTSYGAALKTHSVLSAGGLPGIGKSYTLEAKK